MPTELSIRIMSATATVRYRAVTPSGRFTEEAATVDLFAPDVQADYADSFAALANSGYEQVRGAFERLALAADDDPAPGIPFTPPPPAPPAPPAPPIRGAGS